MRLDAGPLAAGEAVTAVDYAELAALDAADPNHESCATLFSDTDEDLVVPALVLSELDYWRHEP